MDSRLAHVPLLLRIAFGLMATLAGLDKFFDLLADWQAYIAPFAAQLSPVSPTLLMWAVGLVEMAVGLTILAISPRARAYVASGWLCLVTINLVVGGHFDVAVRDLVLAVSAFSLARLSELRAEAPGLRRAEAALAGC